ncbi:MAG TPA: hypothetical protein PK657_13955 [Legionella sp.]|nr:hypothetical protein [Legionella sp.]
MKKMINGFLVAFLTANISSGFAANLKNWQLSEDSIGPIQIDMTLAQAEKKTGIKFNATNQKTQQADDGSCYYVTLKGIKGLSFMITNNKIVRINVSSPEFKTTKGASIGDSETKVKKLYQGKLEVEPHKYESKSNYLTLSDTAKDRAIRFETNGKEVTLMYSGKDNEVHFVEGCL